MNTQANLNTQTIQSKEPNLKDFFAFLVRRRGLTGLIAVSWGFMLGGATLVALTLVITALLGGGERVAVPLSLLLGGYSVYFAAAAMKAIYNRSLPRPLGHLCRLFAEAAFYGMFASLSTAYLAGRIFVVKCFLTYWINKSNQFALQHRKDLTKLDVEAIEQKRRVKKISQSRPRGDSEMTVLHLQTEKLRLTLKGYHEKNEAYLLECRKRARDLGVVLWEKDDTVSLPSDATLLHLLSLRLRSLAIFSMR